MDVTEEKKKNMLDHAQALSMSSKTLYSKALKKEKNRKKQSMRVPLHLFLGTFFFHRTFHADKSTKTITA